MERLLSPPAIMGTQIIDALNWRYATKIFDENRKLAKDMVDPLLEVLRLRSDADIHARMHKVLFSKHRIVATI